MAQDMLIQHHLKRLKLPAMGRQYKKLAQEAAQQNRPYEDYLLSLLELEVAQRDENTQKRLIAQARFPYLRTLDQYDFSFLETCTKPKFFLQGNLDEVCPIQQLREFYGRLPEPKELLEIDGANHLFEGRASEVGDALEDLLGDFSAHNRNER